MPAVVPLLLLGDGITGKFRKETAQTETDRQADRQLLLLTPPIMLFCPNATDLFL